MARRTTPEATQSAVAALDEVVRAMRLEIVPFNTAQAQVAQLPPETRVTVTSAPKHGIDHTLDVTDRIAAVQRPLVVPHIAPRMMKTRNRVDEHLTRLATARIREAFVIGGDGRPVGLYAAAGTPLGAMADHRCRHIPRRAPLDGHLDNVLSQMGQGLSADRPHRPVRPYS